MQQRCNSGPTALMLAKRRVGGGWGGQMPPRYATLTAQMEEVGRARGVRVKTTLVETGHRRQCRALAAASTPGSD